MCPVSTCKFQLVMMCDLRDMFGLAKLVSKHFKTKFEPNLVRITTSTSKISTGYMF